MWGHFAGSRRGTVVPPVGWVLLLIVVVALPLGCGDGAPGNATPARPDPARPSGPDPRQPAATGAPQPAPGATSPGVPGCVPGEVIMRVRDESRAAEAAQAIGGVVASRSPMPGWYLVRLVEGGSVEEALARGRNHPLIEVVEPNFTAGPQAPPTCTAR